MNKIISWLGAGSMAVTLLACGGKVVVDGNASNTGGSTNTGVGGSTATGEPHSCGDLVVPSPATLTDCTPGTSGVGSGGPTTCETDFCDANGNVYGAICTGAACACQLNGFTKCSCATSGVTDFCSGGAIACCPWIAIPL